MRLAGAGWIVQMEKYGSSSVSAIVARGCEALRNGCSHDKARYTTLRGEMAHWEGA